MLLSDIPTPALVVDKTILTANIARWQQHADACGVGLRPHIKTHKSIKIAAMQRAAGACGITAAKLSEAEIFVDAGFNDVFVAYPIVGRAKAAHAAQLALRCRLIVGVESAITIADLSAAAGAAGATIHVRIEVESGLQRCGAPPQHVASLARLVAAAPGLVLDGIFTYRGAWFAGAGGRSPAELGRAEGELMVALAQDLRAAGIPINSVSVGSTPTGWAAAGVSGVTEIRPGTYVFGDMMQRKAESASDADLALQIHCTVISRPSATTATIDGGSKTFAGDINYERAGLPGYAVVSGANGALVRMSEEHGVIAFAEPTEIPVGARLALCPIHVCTTVNLSDIAYLCDSSTNECSPFQIVARGKRT
jgi:D-serine deaminase-like pyridoxal phosphate-dependent protein